MVMHYIIVFNTLNFYLAVIGMIFGSVQRSISIYRSNSDKVDEHLSDYAISGIMSGIVSGIYGKYITRYQDMNIDHNSWKTIYLCSTWILVWNYIKCLFHDQRRICS